MTSAHVLHVGSKDLHRAGVLQAAGYAVDECQTLEELAAWFRLGRRTDLVCISEEPDCPAEGAIALVRNCCSAPLVLFRASDHSYLQPKWDLEFPLLTHPRVWLSELERLLSRSRAIHAASEDLPQSSPRPRRPSAALRVRNMELRKQIARRLDPRNSTAAGDAED